MPAQELVLGLSRGSHAQQLHLATIGENNILLAEFEEDLLKHEHWASAPQDGEGLPSKQGVGDPCHGCSKQRLNCTLWRRKKLESEAVHSFPQRTAALPTLT